MKLYTVKIKDLNQDITHTFSQYSSSQNKANSQALKYLIKTFKHTNFEIL